MSRESFAGDGRIRTFLAGVISGLLAVSALLFAVDFALSFQDQIEIENNSGSDLPRVEVSMGNVVVWAGPLANYRKHSIMRTTPAEGAIKIRFEMPDGAAKTVEFGYVTRGLGSRQSVNVSDQFHVGVVACAAGLLLRDCSGYSPPQ